MDLLHLIALAIIQGLTEFLPISSSAHLILVPNILGWKDQGLSYDIAVHLGSLLAVLGYFRNDLRRLLGAWWRSLGSGTIPADARLVWFVLAATVPVALTGLLLHDFVAQVLRQPLVIAIATMVFAVLLWWADRSGARNRAQAQMRWRDAMWIGAAQVLALVPGTSRAGITMTAALMLGLTRRDAARFSFLLAIPTILLAAGYEVLVLGRSAPAIDWTAMLVVTATAALSAWLAIHVFLKFLERTGMLPYVIYRLLLGGVLLLIFL